MEKFNHYVIQFLKYSFPLVLIAVCGSFFGLKEGNIIYDITGWTTIIWTMTLIYLFIAIAFVPSLRNKVVRKLAGIKENDEREIQITGQISKNVFITMIGACLLLLFLSALRFSVYKASEAEVGPGKTGNVQIGFNTSVVPTKSEVSPHEASRSYIVQYSGLPLSIEGVLLLVILLQLGSFYYFSRKQQVVP